MSDRISVMGPASILASGTDHRRATQADIEARYPAVPLDVKAAINAMVAYARRMTTSGLELPEMCVARATPAAAYHVNGCTAYRFDLESPMPEGCGLIVGYLLPDGDWQAPVAIQEGCSDAGVYPALFKLRSTLE